VKRNARTNVLPGFSLTCGITVSYVGTLVMLPLAALFWKAAHLSAAEFLHILLDPRMLAALKLSLTTSLLASALNTLFGLVVAWVLARYRFFGRYFVEALVDLPFALPTAVAGLALTALYSQTGLFGAPLSRLGIQVAFTPLGLIIALAFVGLPFVVRSVQPVIADLDVEMEEAAAVLGASRWQIFWRVIFPTLMPALLTGFTLAVARAMGEYGSIVFISGNIPLRTEIVPLLIVTKLEQYDYESATALAIVMLTASFVLLLCVNALQRLGARRTSEPS
jgi:sulfate/thiosulfate transport system permease protein